MWRLQGQACDTRDFLVKKGDQLTKKEHGRCPVLSRKDLQTPVARSVPRMVSFVHFHFDMCFARLSTSKSVPNMWRFCHLDFKRGSHRSGVHFWNISGKITPDVRCFGPFDCEICFAPQRRAIFHFSFSQMAPHLPL